MAKKKVCPESEVQVPEVTRKSHPTVDIVLKEAMIDELMVPLVQWLNDFDSVFTIACCQGERGEDKEIDETKKPYVYFYCFDNLQLVKVLSAITFVRYDVKVEVEWDERRAALTYTARWPNLEALLETIECLPPPG